jgi:hypothetical protein
MTTPIDFGAVATCTFTIWYNQKIYQKWTITRPFENYMSLYHIVNDILWFTSYWHIAVVSYCELITGPFERFQKTPHNHINKNWKIITFYHTHHFKLPKKLYLAYQAFMTQQCSKEKWLMYFSSHPIKNCPHPTRYSTKIGQNSTTIHYMHHKLVGAY